MIGLVTVFSSVLLISKPFTDIACPFGSAFTLINNGHAERELDRLLSISVTVKAHFSGVVIATVGSDFFVLPSLLFTPLQPVGCLFFVICSLAVMR